MKKNKDTKVKLPIWITYIKIDGKLIYVGKKTKVSA